MFSHGGLTLEDASQSHYSFDGDPPIAAHHRGNNFQFSYKPGKLGLPAPLTFSSTLFFAIFISSSEPLSLLILFRKHFLPVMLQTVTGQPPYHQTRVHNLPPQ